MVAVIAAEERGDESTADALLVDALEEVTEGLSEQGLPGEVFDERRLSALFLEARRRVGEGNQATFRPGPIPSRRPETNATADCKEVVPDVRQPAQAVTSANGRGAPHDLDIASMIDDMLSRPG